jgi:phosphatidylglycerol lysyltransferase
MENTAIRGFLSNHSPKNRSSFLLDNKKIIGQFIFTLFFIAVAIWFIKHEGTELLQVKSTLTSARWIWVLAGVLFTLMYIVLQGQMYVFAFAATGNKVSFVDSTILFIKRNLIGVFYLPEE